MADEGDAERLVVLLEARIRDFEKNMEKASGTSTRSYGRMRNDSRSATRQMETDMTRATTRINAALATTSTQIGALAKANALALAGGLGLGGLLAGGLVATIQSVSQELAKIGSTADRIGIATDQLQRLREAAERTGGSAEALDRGLTEFTKKLAEAATGTGELKRVLDANGVSLSDSEGKLRSTNDLLMDFANLMRGARSPADQLRLATMAFGEQAGGELVKMLRGGAEGVRRLADDADKTGAVIDEKMIRKAQELDEKFKAVSRTVGTALKTAVVEVADAVADFLALLDKIPRKTGDAVPINDLGKRSLEITRELIMWEKQLDDARNTAAQTGLEVDRQRVGVIEQRIASLKEEDELLQRRGQASAEQRMKPPAGDQKQTTIPESEEQKRLKERLEQLRASLRGEDEVLRVGLEKQLNSIKEFQQKKILTQAEADELEQLAQSEHQDKLRELVLTKFSFGAEAEIELLRLKHEQALEAQRAFEDRYNITVEEGERMRAAIRQKYAQQEAKIREATFTDYTSAAKSALQSLTTIIGAEGDKQIGAQKAIAGAMAAINVAEGITKAFTLGAPLCWVQAAAVAAAGAAQIAAINRMGKGGGAVTSPGEGAGSTSAAPATPAASQPQPMSISLSLQGRSFDREQLREMIDSLNEMHRDGYRLLVT